MTGDYICRIDSRYDPELKYPLLAEGVFCVSKCRIKGFESS